MVRNTPCASCSRPTARRVLLVAPTQARAVTLCRERALPRRCAISAQAHYGGALRGTSSDGLIIYVYGPVGEELAEYLLVHRRLGAEVRYRT